MNQSPAMRVKIIGREDGAIPSEVVVTISTTRGSEEVVVHASQATADSVEAGVIGERHGEVLIGLPRETLSGRSRVWISKDDVSEAD